MNALTECRNDAPPTPASKAPILQSVKPSFQNLTLITPLSILPSLTSSLAASLAKIYNPKPPLLLANKSSSLGSTEYLRFAPSLYLPAPVVVVECRGSRPLIFLKRASAVDWRGVRKEAVVGRAGDHALRLSVDEIEGWRMDWGVDVVERGAAEGAEGWRHSVGLEGLEGCLVGSEIGV